MGSENPVGALLDGSERMNELVESIGSVVDVSIEALGRLGIP